MSPSGGGGGGGGGGSFGGGGFGGAAARALPPASAEQAAVVAAVLGGRHVLVEACAGAGKTTTALHIALAWREAARAGGVAVVTYSRALKDDTEARFRARGLGADDADVVTIHGLAQRAYGVACHTDDGLDAVLARDAALDAARAHRGVGVWVLDEVQDLTPLRFAVLSKLVRDVAAAAGPAAPPPQLVVLGDALQTVYAFMGADARFLTRAPDVWGVGGEWARLRLSTSYRLPPNVCDFVNRAVHRNAHPPILPAAGRAAGPPVRYLTGGTFDAVAYMSGTLKRLFRVGTYRFDEVMVLNNTLKLSPKITPLQKFVELLGTSGVPVHLREHDMARDPEIEAGKVLVSTNPGSKGQERALVICFGFSASYFKFVDKGARRDKCPPALHVAATRAKAELWIVAEEQPGAHIDFLDRGAVEALVGERKLQVISSKIRKLDDAAPPIKPTYTASALVSFLDSSWLKELHGKLALERVAPPAHALKLCSSVKMESGLVESVAEVNGLALPLLLESLSRDSTIFETIKGFARETQVDESAGATDLNLLARTAARLVEADPFRGRPRPLVPADVRGAVPWALEAAALYRALEGGYPSPFYVNYSQLVGSGFSWIDDATAVAVVERLAAAIPSHSSDSTTYEAVLKVLTPLADVEGQIDVLAEGEDTLVEIKCVSGPLAAEHFLQLAVYAWLHRHGDEEDGNDDADVEEVGDSGGGGGGGGGGRGGAPFAYELFNATSGEHWRLDAAASSLDFVINALLSLKTKVGRLTDGDFVAAAQVARRTGPITSRELRAAFKIADDEAAAGAKRGREGEGREGE